MDEDLERLRLGHHGAGDGRARLDGGRDVGAGHEPLDRGHPLGHVPDVTGERRRQRRSGKGRRRLERGRLPPVAHPDRGRRARDRVRGHPLDGPRRPARRPDRRDPQRRWKLDRADDDRHRRRLGPGGHGRAQWRDPDRREQRNRRDQHPREPDGAVVDGEREPGGAAASGRRRLPAEARRRLGGPRLGRLVLERRRERPVRAAARPDDGAADRDARARAGEQQHRQQRAGDGALLRRDVPSRLHRGAVRRAERGARVVVDRPGGADEDRVAARHGRVHGRLPQRRTAVGRLVERQELQLRARRRDGGGRDRAGRGAARRRRHGRVRDQDRPGRRQPADGRELQLQVGPERLRPVRQRCRAAGPGHVRARTAPVDGRVDPGRQGLPHPGAVQGAVDLQADAASRTPSCARATAASCTPSRRRRRCRAMARSCSARAPRSSCRAARRCAST